ncbi:hypothetical protein [Poseidonibacter ostreae]|jgi:hypothetical protein|uniref:Uncharacterized protein n=2 Tax=Poseidonibacter ostreae TaxID=2654171 RepID=A0A6L4WQS0_9BACT|nr:hypothetical protein [Poseidonibacter ostreae]KAB7887256.1 hypothetical protein GBG19_10995 [Poseidonibacter ostreae]KAB7889527.1 hypothetical protein GBG18_10900 [Poseidonibacter ostreae]MAC82922.1 hypothetical protein [Arcobacter sp.]|tara:strand:- start:6532 stop:7116 length:585 start_codon:yes stop_codon:yes gene_type:complete
MGFITRTLKSIVKSVVRLSRPVFNFEDNILSFKVNPEYFYSYEIDNYETKTRHDSYTIDAYSIKSNSIFIEYIHSHSDVQWRALPSSLYIEFLKDRLGFKSMDLLEKKEYKNFDFYTFKIDNHFILNFIYVYELNKDVFILDIKSELYENLLKNFDKEYIYKFEKNKEDVLDIDISIVKENNFFNYFGHEDMSN